MARKTKATKKVSSKDVKEFDLVNGVIVDDKAEGEKPSSEPIKSKRITHFDIINYMFTDIKAFNNLTKYVLEQNFFMLNRTFSIKYPLQAQFFNKLNVNMASVVRFWQKFLVSKEGFGRKPFFVFTKGAKKSSESKAKADSFNKDLICEYCKRYHLSLRDFNDMLYFFNEQTVESVKKFEQFHSPSEQAKMFSMVKHSKKEKPKEIDTADASVNENGTTKENNTESKSVDSASDTEKKK